MILGPIEVRRSPSNGGSSQTKWPLRKLGDVCKITARIVNPTLARYRDLPHIFGNNIISGQLRLSYLNSASEDGMCSGKYLFDAGDVLYSKLRPYLRKVFLPDFPGLCSADMYPIKVDRSVMLPEYLAWALLSPRFTAYADSESRRARMPKINREQLLAWSISCPPLAVQKRVVAKLSNQMAAVELARAAVEAQLDAARRLGRAQSRETFSPSETRRWTTKRLLEISTVSGGIQKTPDRAPRKFHRPFLTVRNVQRGLLDLSTVERFEITPEELVRYRLEPGDILIVEGNGSRSHIGRSAIFQGEPEDCIHQNHIIRVRVDRRIASAEFVNLFLNSGRGAAQMLEKAMTTTGLYTLSVSKIEQLELPLPPPEEQIRIIERAQRIEALTGKAEKAVRERLDAIEALPAQLLSEAFLDLN